MDGDKLLIVLMVVLVLLAGVQAYQLNTVTQLLTSPTFTASMQKSAGAAVAPVSLPTQVGGCG